MVEDATATGAFGAGGGGADTIGGGVGAGGRSVPVVLLTDPIGPIGVVDGIAVIGAVTIGGGSEGAWDEGCGGAMPMVLVPAGTPGGMTAVGSGTAAASGKATVGG